jgi:hypothetical protein
MQMMQMNPRHYRASPDQREWELPAWGHPIAQGVMPLLLGIHGKLFPIGTAFSTGQIHFMVTATHNIEQIMTHDPRFAHKINRGRLDGNHNLSDGYALYVLHHRVENDKDSVTLWPLRKIDGASPGDVVFASPQYAKGIQTLVSPLSFDIPAIGEKMLSVGYSDFDFPEDGIDIADVQAGTFDWHNAYKHRLYAAEGTVQRVFTTQFSSGFVAGSCFAFDVTIRHGMSGGPIYNWAGNVCGVNSAGAELYFNAPMSLGSLLYPMLTRQLRFGAEIGPIAFNSTQPMLDLIARGTLKTDGSEQRVVFTNDPVNGELIANPRCRIEDRPFIHDDFEGYQADRSSTKLEGEHFVVRIKDAAIEKS